MRYDTDVHSKSTKERQISYVQNLIRGTFAASVTHAGILSLASILNEFGQFSKVFCH